MHFLEVKENMLTIYTEVSLMYLSAFMLLHYIRLLKNLKISLTTFIFMHLIKIRCNKPRQIIATFM